MKDICFIMIDRKDVEKVKNTLLTMLMIYLLFPALVGVGIALVVGYFFPNMFAVGLTLLLYSGMLVIVMIGQHTGYPFLSFLVSISFGIALVFFPSSELSVDFMEIVTVIRSETHQTIEEIKLQWPSLRNQIRELPGILREGLEESWQQTNDS